MSANDVERWGGIALAAIAVVLAVWNKFGIRSLNVKTDGMMEYRSRADRAEGKLEEQGDVRDRADKKELNGR